MFANKKVLLLKTTTKLFQLLQGTVALGFNAPALDRKIEGSNLAANFSFERTTMTREKRGDEFGNEDRKRRARRTNDHRRVKQARSTKKTRS